MAVELQEQAVILLNECIIAPGWKESWSLLMILCCLDKRLHLFQTRQNLNYYYCQVW